MATYNKPAMTIEAQITKLCQRGLQITDKTHIMRDLEQKNYYRLRAYWLPFERMNKFGEHVFLPETTWNKVMELYEFDRELRLLILSAIERIEISARTRWAHVLSLKYGAHAHENEKIFFDATKHQEHLARLRQEYLKSREVFADHFRNNYPTLVTPPIWSVCELMSLGELSRWYGMIKLRSDRNAIAACYGIDEMVLRSFLHHLTVVRNLCAHHSRLWNRKLALTLKIPKKQTRYFAGGKVDKIYPTVVMLWLLLQTVEPKCNWLQQLKRLFVKYPGVNSNKMGFPSEWEALLQ